MAFIVYMIKNKVSGKIYIGATTQSLRRRYWGDDLSINGPNKFLKDDAKIFGKDAFEFSELCICNSKEDMDKKENEFIVSFNSVDPSIGYNMKLGGIGYGFGEKHRDNVILNLGNNRTLGGWKRMWDDPERRMKACKAISAAAKGKKRTYSEESLKKLREVAIQNGLKNRGKKRPKRSEETKKKQSESRKKYLESVGGFSEETRKRMSEAQKRRKAPSDETKRKISETMKKIRSERFWTPKKHD